MYECITECLNIFQGELPVGYIFALKTVGTWAGETINDVTNFKTLELDRFELLLDGFTLPGYPLSMTGSLPTNFYLKYLK